MTLTFPQFQGSPPLQKPRVNTDPSLLTRPSWTDASIALAQVNKGKATGNRAALWCRSRIQVYLYAIGSFVEKHAGKVLFVGLLVLATFCVGLKSSYLETDVDKLWVEAGGRLEEERHYVKETLGEGSAMNNQILIQTPRQDGGNILHPSALFTHLKALLKATSTTVHMFDITWSLKDVCFAPTLPSFDEYYIEQIVNNLFPCLIITPLDCFWEGSKVVGPEFPVSIPGMKDKLQWSSLNPQRLLDTAKAFEFSFPLNSIRTLMKRAGITTGYQEKPCLDPGNPECPDTAPNKHSRQTPNIGEELTGGCYGFARRYMHWPEAVVVGGTEKNRTGYIVKAQAFQSIVVVLGAKELYNYHYDTYKVHHIDWSVEKAQEVLTAWQESFMKEMNAYAASPNSTKYTKISSFSDEALNRLLVSFSNVSVPRVVCGYVAMGVYVVFCLMNWEKRIESMVGAGLTGVFLVAASVAAGLGMCALCGIVFNALTTQVIPFLALGLGVNDLFIMTRTYKEVLDSGVEYRCIIGEVVKRAAAVMLMTSKGAVLTFLSAALVPIPALRSFALQSAVLVVFNFCSMLLIYPAVLAIDLHRRNARRCDVLCCLSGEEEPIHIPQEMNRMDKPRPKWSKVSRGANKVLPDPSKKQAVTRVTSSTDSHTTTHIAPPQECWAGPWSEKPSIPSLESVATTTGSTGDLIRIKSRRKFRFNVPSIDTLVKYYYAPLLSKTASKLLIMAFCTCLLGISVYGVVQLEDGLELTDIVPHGTSEHEFLVSQNKYFGFFQIYAVTRGDFHYPTNQELLYEYHKSFMRVHPIIKDDDGGLPDFWLNMFRDWLKELQAAFDREWQTGCINQEGWFKNASSDGILAYKLLVQTGHVDNPIDKSLVKQVRLVNSEGIINPKAFYNYLSAWASNDALAYSASQANLVPEPRVWNHDPQDVELRIPKSAPITYAQIPFFVNKVGNTGAIKDLIQQVRAITSKFEERGLPNFPEGVPFTFWEQYVHLRLWTTLALAVAFACIFGVNAVVLANPHLALVITSVLAVMVVELFGLMGLLRIRLSAVPAVIAIMCVGLGMEFTQHIAVAFVTCTGSRSRRMERSLEFMFPPVFHGGVSTLIGVVMLAISEFDFVFRYFFIVLAALVCIGMFNGLVLLPVLLSVFGPKGEVEPVDGRDEIQEPSPEPSPVLRSLGSVERGPPPPYNPRHPRPTAPPRRMNSDLSLSTITEEPNSSYSNNQQPAEIVVQPEVVVETTTHLPGQTTDSGPPSPHPPHQVTTKVTATTKVKVEVHTPLPGAVEREHSYKHRRRRGTSSNGSSSSSSAKSSEGDTTDSSTKS